MCNALRDRPNEIKNIAYLDYVYVYCCAHIHAGYVTDWQCGVCIGCDDPSDAILKQNSLMIPSHSRDLPLKRLLCIQVPGRLLSLIPPRHYNITTSLHRHGHEGFRLMEIMGDLELARIRAERGLETQERGFGVGCAVVVGAGEDSEGILARTEG